MYSFSSSYILIRVGTAVYCLHVRNVLILINRWFNFCSFFKYCMMYPKSKFVEREQTKCNFLLWAHNIFLFFIFHNTYHGNQLQTAECRGAFTLWAHYKTFSKLYIYIFVPVICSLALICSV